MKKMLFGFIVVFCSHLLTAQTYTARITIDDIFFQNHNEWKAFFHAELYLDGALQPPSSSYSYSWWKRPDGQAEFQFDTQNSGPGAWQATIDNDNNRTIVFYVDITVSGVHVISPNVPIVKIGVPQEVRMFARTQNGVPFQGSEYETIGLWTDYTWHWIFPTIEGAQHHYMTGENPLKIKPNTDLLGEKFHRGITSQNSIVYQNYSAYNISFSNTFDELTFHHRPFYGVGVAAELIDDPSQVLNIRFKDPWLEDLPGFGGENASQGMTAPFKSHASPWNISTISEYRGVFLNENSQWDPLKPNYSVDAPTPQTINGFESNFLNWNGDPNYVSYQNSNLAQTGVVFKQAGATATAKYKAHLRSSSSSATASNTQRKIIRDASGYYHLAYESANNIFYTKSTNIEGTSWGGEILLSEDGDINRTPSLSVQDDLVVVAWERYNEYAGENANEYAVVARTVSVAGSQCGGLVVLQYVYNYPALSYQTMPVVATYVSGSTRYTLAVWYDGVSSALKAAVRNGSNGTWSAPTTLRSVVPAYFSLTPISLNINSGWQFAWVESGNLYCAPIPIGTTPVLGTAQLVASGGGEIEIHAPSAALIVTQYGSRPAICWQEYDSEFERRVIKYREKGNTSWSPTTMVWSEPNSWTSAYYTPTLGAHPSSNNVSIVWRVSAQQLRYVQRASYAWTSQTNLSSGVDPMLSIGATYTGSELVLARGTSSLYPLQFTALNYGQEELIAEGMQTPEGRGGTVTIAEGTIGLAIESATLNEAPIAFAAVNDTVPIAEYEQFSSAMESEPFVPTGRLRLGLRYHASENIPARANVRLALVDDATGKVVRQLRVFAGTRDTVLTLDVRLDERSRLVRIAALPIGVEGKATFEVERWNLFTDDQPEIANSNTLSKEVIAEIPMAFAVQAFPNPFNPSTQVNFDLPENSNVSLVVYDVLGRKVADLAGGYHAAGNHSATWNATEFASGVYFARFTATDANGIVKLSKVSKLLLAK